MKNFICLIISIVIYLTLTSGVQKTSENTISVTLQSTGNNVTSSTLKQSADIISARLKLYGLNSFDINIAAEKGQIKVQLTSDVEVSEIEGLLTSRGQLAFYETYTHNEITDILKPGDQLFELLNSDNGNNPGDPRVGCISSGNLKKVDEYVRSMNPVRKCKLFWGVDTQESENCLFALKTNEEGNPLLVRSDVETIKSAVTKGSKVNVTQFKLKPSSINIFADATRNNLNKAIAIVIDDQVYYWPVVKTVISSGEIEVTGNFSEKEVNYFLALVNTDLLPLRFNLLK